MRSTLQRAHPHPRLHPIANQTPALPFANTQDGKEIGGLWRYTPDGCLHEILDHKVRCSNCVCFSPDGSTM